MRIFTQVVETLLCLWGMTADAVTISDIEVFSGWPWKEVVIGYTIKGIADGPLVLQITARDNVVGKTYQCVNVDGVCLDEGRHIIKWNASADNAKFKSSNVVFTAEIEKAGLYCVVDLSQGVFATYYPVSWLDSMPNGGWTDEYKTTKLVLRKVAAGTFEMQNKYEVTLSRSFFIGVFEVTQKQYELVMGANPSYFKGDMRPVDSVSYNMIRGSSAGASWPEDNAVDIDSFLGRLRSKTGFCFDLPTEAQWEYACRAGTTNEYNNGGLSLEDLRILGRYYGNRRDGNGGYSDAHTTVGAYLPNAWGLYDFHGNVREWCLDWYGSVCSMTDPKGASSGSFRIYRGGDWYENFSANFWASSYRMFSTPGEDSWSNGFRVSFPGHN